MQPELAGLPPLLHAARNAAGKLRLAAEVAKSQGLHVICAHFSRQAQALDGAIACAEPYARVTA